MRAWAISLTFQPVRVAPHDEVRHRIERSEAFRQERFNFGRRFASDEVVSELLADGNSEGHRIVKRCVPIVVERGIHRRRMVGEVLGGNRNSLCCANRCCALAFCKTLGTPFGTGICNQAGEAAFGDDGVPLLAVAKI